MKKFLSFKNNKGFFLRVILPSILAVILFLVSFFVFIVPSVEESLMDRKKEMIRELTNSVWSIVQQYEKEEQQGVWTRAVAQQKAIAEIKQIRYGKDMLDYFWITDLRPVMVMHPIRTDLDGKSLHDFSDAHGKKLFVDCVTLVRKENEGYVDYMWQSKEDPTQTVPKLSFVKEFKPWEWIIGTGIYIEDARAEIQSLTQKLISITLVIAFLVALLLWYIFYQSLKIELKKRQAENELHESKEKYKSLVEASTEGLIMLIDGNITFVNDVLLKMTGFKTDELMGLGIKTLVSEQNNRELIKKFSDSNIEEGQYEIRLVTKNQAAIEVLITVSISNQLKQSVTILIIKDISIDRETHLSAMDYQKLLSHLQFGFFRIKLGKKASFEFANPTTLRLLGYQHIQDLGTTDLYDFIIQPAEIKRIRFQLFKSGFVSNKMLHLQKSDFSTLIVSLTLIVIENENHQELICDGIIEDITVREHEKADWMTLINAQKFSSFLLEQQVKDYLGKIHRLDMEASIQEAIEKMERKNTECLLIVQNKNQVLGIITITDIQKRVLSLKLRLDNPVYLIMSSPVVSISENTSINAAFLFGENHKINHIPVKTQSGEWMGMLNLNALLRQLKNTLSLQLNQVKTSNSSKDLVKAHQSLVKFIKPLIQSDILPSYITDITATFSDAVTQRIIEISLMKLGKPPVGFLFVVMGSEGRREETLLTDQDNALIFEDVPAEKLPEVKKYFDQLGQYVCDALHEVGYTYCKGNIMAKNPHWTQPYSKWVQYFSHWINTPEPENVIEASIFFDIRGVYGDGELLSRLRSQVQPLIAQNETFIYHLAHHTYYSKPPVLPSGNLHADKLDPIDIKNAMSIMTMFARTYSLKHDIRLTHTLERLECLKEQQIISIDTYSEFKYVYNYLFKLRFKNQLEALNNHVPIHNFLHLKNHTESELILIRRLLQVIPLLQNKIATDFRIKF